MLPIPHSLATTGALGVLFAEDFDDPPGVTILDDAADSAGPGGDPASGAGSAVEPPPAMIDLDAERAAAFAQGRLDALSEIAAATARQREEQTRLLAEIATLLRDSEAAARAMAEEAADSIARLLLASLGCVLPSLCARHGDAEAVAVARIVMPPLIHVPEVTVRVHPDTSPALEALINSLEPQLRQRIRLVTDTMDPGDIRIEWPDGFATRDAAALWKSVVAVLAPLGLIDTTAPSFEGPHGR